MLSLDQEVDIIFWHQGGWSIEQIAAGMHLPLPEVAVVVLRGRVSNPVPPKSVPLKIPKANELNPIPKLPPMEKPKQVREYTCGGCGYRVVYRPCRICAARARRNMISIGKMHAEDIRAADLRLAREVEEAARSVRAAALAATRDTEEERRSALQQRAKVGCPPRS